MTVINTVAPDVVATGQIVAGPVTNSLSAGWDHASGSGAGIILVGFQYNTTAPATKSILRTVTVGGNALTPLKPPPGQGEFGKGWGVPKKGWVEVWGGVGAAAAGGTVAVGLDYSQIVGDLSSPTDATFFQFSGTSLTYVGCNVLPEPNPRNGIQGRAAAGKLISVGVSAFMDTQSVIFVGSDGPISEDAVHANSRFLDANANLWVGDRQGPGTVRLQTTGGIWGAVVVNLMPTG